MSDYIKREDAISQLEPLCDRMHEEGGLIDPDCELGINESIEVIKAIPAADVVEVRHGYWEKLQGDSRCRCSFCKCRELVPTCNGEPIIWDYCPNCGVRMDGGGDDE